VGGTVRVQGTGANQYVASPVNFTDVNGTLYFVGETSAHGIELWKSDGTAAGTVLVKDVNPGKDGGVGQNLTVIDGILYFGASSAAGKQELWQSDGTTTGTTFVFDFTRALDPMYPRDITGIGDKLLVVARTALTGEELWIGQLPPLTGDYDGNRRVDGNDFLLWQRQLGQPVAAPGDGPDGDASGTVDAGDLTVWSDHYGKPTVAAAVAAAAAAAMGVEHRNAPFNADLADAVFAAGDFTSLFSATGSASTRPRFRPHLRR
jgi:ELWxxDGT repeat protein